MKMSITWQPGDNSPIRSPFPRTTRQRGKKPVATLSTSITAPRKNVVAQSLSTSITVPAEKRKNVTAQAILSFPKRVKRVPYKIDYQDEDVSPSTLAGMPTESLAKKAKWYQIVVSKKFPTFSNPMDVQAVAYLLRGYLEIHNDRRVGITHIHHFKSLVYPTKRDTAEGGSNYGHINIILHTNCRNIADAIRVFLAHCGHQLQFL